MKGSRQGGGTPDSACYNAIVEGLSYADSAMDAYGLFEETRLKGQKIHAKTCIALWDALCRAECVEQAAIVGAVMREVAHSQHAARSW